MKLLIESLEQAGILGCIDLIILSDHGMAPTPLGEKFLLLDDYVPNIGNDTIIFDEVFPAILPRNDSKGKLLDSFFLRCGFFKTRKEKLKT